VLKTQRKSLLTSASNKTDFDYLFLRKKDNSVYYEKVNKVLHQYYEENVSLVFSEFV